MSTLVLVRHGQSIWNAQNRFTGWTDVELSEKGIDEAEEAGRQLSQINFGVVHTSDLIRAQRTAEIIMELNVGKFIMRVKELNPFKIHGFQNLKKTCRRKV